MLLEKISPGTPDDVPALHDHGDQQMLRFPFGFCVVKLLLLTWNHVCMLTRVLVLFI